MVNGMDKEMGLDELGISAEREELMRELTSRYVRYLIRMGNAELRMILDSNKYTLLEVMMRPKEESKD